MSKPKQQENVRVGVGVLVKDPADGSKVFCGIRKGSHGAGSLALPGGHLEMMECWEECASREIKEEMGIELINLRFAHVTNDVMATEEKHYVTIFMIGEFKDSSAIPRNMEPNKCEGWKSFSWEELKEIRNEDAPKLFGPVAKLVDDSPASITQFLLNT